MKLIHEPFTPVLKFNEQELGSMQFYFEVNLRYADQINKELKSQLIHHELWGPILASINDEDAKAQNAISLELQRKAIYENNWDQYNEMLISQGKIYAQMNVGYADWYDIVGRYKFLILPYIQRDFAESTNDAIMFLDGLSRFTDYAMYVISEAYFQEKTGLKKLNEDLERKVALRTAELEASNKELESFSYSVSHDLRAPIRAINGYANILVEDNIDQLDEEGKKSVNAIKRNSKKMGELIDDLLAFSRLGKKEVNASKLDMNMLIQTVLEEFREEIDKKKVTLTIAPLPVINGDMSLLRQVWINLLSNALKYSGQRSEIRIDIGIENTSDQHIFYIRDNGVGFDMEYYDQLFGVFQRLHSPEEFEGTGIGLAIVKKIIKRHGGKVWAEAKRDMGATFYFSLPNINS